MERPPWHFLKRTQNAVQTPCKPCTKPYPFHIIAQAAENLIKPIENCSFAGALGDQLTPACKDFRALFFPRLIFFRALFFSAPYFYCGRPSEPASGRPAGCLEACKGQIAFRSSISASYFFPRLIFISADPRISWRAARLDFRILFFSASYFSRILFFRAACRCCN